jgi:DNA polymerase-1
LRSLWRKRRKLLLLIDDSDVTCHHAAAAAEEEIQWDEFTWTIHCDLNRAKEIFSGLLKSYQEATGTKELRLCFSGRNNFRKVLNPQYKSNRTGRKPVGYSALREWAMATYPSFCKEGLEADDCLGILATKYPGKTIIRTIDKDLLGVPGKMYRTSPNGSGEWHDTDEKTADFRFLSQALSGDAVDGYSGIPGIGPKKAEDLLRKHGAVWKTVVDAYEKAGMTEEDALMNARMARILRVSDWDQEKEEVKLWTP